MAKSTSDRFHGNVVFDINNEEQIVLSCNKQFSWHLSRLLKEIERDARAIVEAENSTYSKTGNLKSSIHSDGVSTIRGTKRISGSVSAGSAKAPYAKFVHEGTKPHWIISNKGEGMLKFNWTGRTGRRAYAVHVVAKRQSANSREYGSSIGSTGRGDTFPARDTLQTTGLDGMAGYNRKKKHHAIGREKRRRGGKIEIMRSPRYMRIEHRWGRGKINDRSVMVPYVYHPGYKGNPFLNKAATAVMLRRGWNTPF